MVVVKVFLCNMKQFIKFIKYFALVVFIYIGIYIAYISTIIASKIDLYFILLLALCFMISYWTLTGLYSPKKTPLFKVKKRLLVALIGVLSLCTIAGTFITVEVYLFKRNAINTAYKNIYYLYHSAKRIHPFHDDALTRFHEEEDNK